MYEDSSRVGTTTATRQIPVSELLARHRGEQFPPMQAWEEPSPCETTDVIPAVTGNTAPPRALAADSQPLLHDVAPTLACGPVPRRTVPKL